MTAVVADAKSGMTRDEQGCFISIMIVAMGFLITGWALGEFWLAPHHCGGPVCEGWTRQLRLSMVSSFAGMGCLALAAVNKLPKLFLLLGAGVLGYTAFTSIGSIGTIMLVGVDFLLFAGVIGWLLMTWRGR